MSMLKEYWHELGVKWGRIRLKRVLEEEKDFNTAYDRIKNEEYHSSRYDYQQAKNLNIRSIARQNLAKSQVFIGFLNRYKSKRYNNK